MATFPYEIEKFPLSLCCCVRFAKLKHFYKYVQIKIYINWKTEVFDGDEMAMLLIKM